MSFERFTFHAERTGDTVIATLAGELDAAATFRIEPELERLTRETGVASLVIDMERVTFLDSSVLGLLLSTQQRLQAEEVGFSLANPSDAVRRLLELTGVGRALPVSTRPRLE